MTKYRELCTVAEARCNGNQERIWNHFYGTPTSGLENLGLRTPDSGPKSPDQKSDSDSKS